MAGEDHGRGTRATGVATASERQEGNAVRATCDLCIARRSALLSDLDEQLSMSDGGLDVSGDPLSRALDDTDKVRGDSALAAACLCGL